MPQQLSLMERKPPFPYINTINTNLCSLTPLSEHEEQISPPSCHSPTTDSLVLKIFNLTRSTHQINR